MHKRKQDTSIAEVHTEVFFSVVIVSYVLYVLGSRFGCETYNSATGGSSKIAGVDSRGVLISQSYLRAWVFLSVNYSTLFK